MAGFAKLRGSEPGGEMSLAKSNGSRLVHFGVFEVDCKAGELRRSGSKVKLQEQPFQILTMLLETPGEVISREELRNQLWPADTFVDFDHSLNAAVRRLRDALGDSAENPRFVETVARRGYRFIAPVNGATQQAAPRAGGRRRWLTGAAIGIVLLVGIVIGFHAARRLLSTQRPQERRLTANPAEAPVTKGVISPDGKYLAFSDQTGFYLRRIDSGETYPVALSSGFKPEPVSWFPDGTHLAVTWVAGARELPSIWEISTMGGAPRKLADMGWNPSVSPDGALSAFSAGSQSSQELWIMQADGENAHKLATGNETCFGLAAWSPDSQRIAYVRAKYHPGTMGSDAQIEIAYLQGGRTSLVLADPRLGPGLAWSRDGRLIYSLQETPPNQGDFNLWWMRVSDRTGRPSGTPVRITSEPGGIDRISVSADGKRLAFIRQDLQRDVYISELEAGGTKLSPPRLLTLDERQDFPYDWTPDSKAVLFASDRDGTYHIFRQGIDQRAPELVVGGNEDLAISRLGPDGSSIFYLVTPKLGETSTTVRLMRVPLNGGPPHFVLEAPGIHNQQCARLPSTLCLFSEIGPSGAVKLLSFDPVNGATKEISVPKLAGENLFPYNWSLSPDGKTLARALKPGSEKKPTIDFFSLVDGTERTITLPAWAAAASIDWAADSKSLWAGAYTNTNTWSLLNIDMQGRVRPMLEDKNMVIGWAIPSPDGRRLAIWKASGTSNVWMVEDF